MRLAVTMMVNSPRNECAKRMTSTRSPRHSPRARRSRRRASTQRQTPYPPGRTPQLRGPGPLPLTLRRTGVSLLTEARPQRTLGSTIGTSLRRQPCGARGKCRRPRLARLVDMAGNRLVSSLVLHVVSGSDLLCMQRDMQLCHIHYRLDLAAVLVSVYSVDINAFDLFSSVTLFMATYFMLLSTQRPVSCHALLVPYHIFVAACLHDWKFKRGCCQKSIQKTHLVPAHAVLVKRI